MRETKFGKRQEDPSAESVKEISALTGVEKQCLARL